MLDYYDRTFSVDKIKNSLNKTSNIFWIAMHDQRPVAYAKLKLNSESEFLNSKQVCQLQKIYVLNDFLSMKIGFELQKKLLEKAKDIKFEHIWLSVLGANERAITFYEKSGFKKIGDHDFQIGKENFDFVAMSKKLN